MSALDWTDVEGSDAEVRETLAAGAMFHSLCSGAADAERSGDVTQYGLLYSLWCCLSIYLIGAGSSSQDMCEAVLYAERRQHGQGNPS